MLKRKINSNNMKLENKKKYINISLNINKKKSLIKMKKYKPKFYYLKNIRRILKLRLKNEELFKIKKFISYYFYLKKWKKTKLRFWRYFLSFRHKYFNRYYAKIIEWKNFKYLKKELYFWFKRRTKRQLYVLKKKFVLLKKGSKIKNYFTLKRKYFKNKYYKKKRKYFIFFYNIYSFSNNLKKIYIFFKLLLKILLLFVIYSIKYLFYKLNSNLQRLKIFFIKSLKRQYKFTEFIDLKELNFIRSNWLQRIKRRRKYIYKNFKSEKKANFFFNLKKRIFFFLNLPNLKNQFYYLIVKTVDTNLYITLTNSKHQVIIYRSTGHVSENRKKKIKLSPFTINNMIYDIIGKMKKIKIKHVVVNINSKINKNIKNVFRTIGSSLNVNLVKAEFSKPIPHHSGNRKPKPRRL